MNYVFGEKISPVPTDKAHWISKPQSDQCFPKSYPTSSCSTLKLEKKNNPVIFQLGGFALGYILYQIWVWPKGEKLEEKQELKTIL